VEVADLRQGLGSEDRPKLEAHLESLRELERGLDVHTSRLCRAPAVGQPISDAEDALPEQLRLHLDVAAAAVACDLSRVITIQVGSGASRIAHKWVGREPEPPRRRPRQRGRDRLVRRIASAGSWPSRPGKRSRFMYLLGKLDAVRESAGRTALDNSAVLWAHEQSNGGTHLRGTCPTCWPAAAAAPSRRVARWLSAARRTMGC